VYHQPVFDMCGLQLPDGDWAYEVDDFDIAYGPGWWPYHRDGQPSGVRLAPNTRYWAWRNEYVLAHPTGRGPTVHAGLQLYERKQGMGAMIVRCRVVLDLKHGSFTVDERCPPHLRPQADTKAQRLLDLILAARRERRRGQPAPLTAHQRWLAAKEDHQ